MELSEEYIKMILALPDEFFEDWNWQAGDRAITKDGREVLIIDPPLVQHSRGNGWLKGIFPESAYDEWDIFKKEDLRPIPSQEQLQEIITLNFQDSGLVFEDKRDTLYLNWRFETWLRDQMFEEKVGLSFKCLWLEFLMYAIYNKKWNGEKWQ